MGRRKPNVGCLIECDTTLSYVDSLFSDIPFEFHGVGFGLLLHQRRLGCGNKLIAYTNAAFITTVVEILNFILSKSAIIYVHFIN